jgi:hypothetical protein
LSVDNSFDGGVSRVRLTQIDGASFDLSSLYVYSAQFGFMCSGCVLDLESSSGGHSTFAPLSTMTFSGPDWTRVAWVDFVAGGDGQLGVGTGVGLDDIVVTPSSVPLPPAAWLLASAASLLAPLRRRR